MTIYRAFNTWEDIISPLSHLSGVLKSPGSVPKQNTTRFDPDIVYGSVRIGEVEEINGAGSVPLGQWTRAYKHNHYYKQMQ